MAESILGWESKFRLGADYVTGSDDHGVFLQSQFERFLFSEAELDDLIVYLQSISLQSTGGKP